MPTLFRVGPYRFYCYAGDRNEPPHIHIERDDKEAKFWLKPVHLQNNKGFGSVRLEVAVISGLAV